MVNVLLAASPATRSRPRAIKGQEPGLVDVLLQPPEQTRSPFATGQGAMRERHGRGLLTRTRALVMQNIVGRFARTQS